MLRSLIKRFLKGIIAGAVASMVVVTFNQPGVWSDFSAILNSLAIAAAYGGLTGFLMALQKWASWKDDVYL